MFSATSKIDQIDSDNIHKSGLMFKKDDAANEN